MADTGLREKVRRTALNFAERLRPLAKRFAARHGRALANGVRINTGEAVVGTIGAEQQLEYIAIRHAPATSTI